MSHPVLSLGAAAVTAAGCVWYLPALAELRAGDDRPRSTRLAAVACLVWWLALAAAGALLLTPAAWQLPTAVALTGAVCGSLLRLAARAGRSSEQREQARQWATIPLPLRAPLVPHRNRPATTAWLVAALTTAPGIATATVVLGRPGTAGTMLVTVGSSVGVCLLTVLIAIHREAAGGPGRG